MNLMVVLPEPNPLAAALVKGLKAELAQVTVRRFPDGETYVRVQSKCQDRIVLMVASLYPVDEKIMPLLFLAKTLKDLGATRVILVCPYLAYLRQDRCFHSGEALTSKYFAQLLSHYFDGLITIDPHLHRYHSLKEIYTMPTQIVHAAPQLSQWIRQHVCKPLLIGPDQESSQWVQEIAQRSEAPYLILEKIRQGDRKVKVSFPSGKSWQGHTPVLVDDIISTGQTLIETVKILQKAKLKDPICIGIHPLCVDGAYDNLLASGVKQVVSCNTILHPSNEIDLGDVLLKGVRALLSVWDSKR